MKFRVLTAVCVGVALAFGCSQQPKEADWSPEAANLVVYATQIPLFPGADVEDAMGSDLYGDDRRSHMKGMAIWFQTPSTSEELEAWYDLRMAEAEKARTDDGYVTFTMVPEGGAPNETIGVIIEEDGKFRVFERVQADRARS